MSMFDQDTLQRRMRTFRNKRQETPNNFITEPAPGASNTTPTSPTQAPTTPNQNNTPDPNNWLSLGPPTPGEYNQYYSPPSQQYLDSLKSWDQMAWQRENMPLAGQDTPWEWQESWSSPAASDPIADAVVRVGFPAGSKPEPTPFYDPIAERLNQYRNQYGDPNSWFGTYRP